MMGKRQIEPEQASHAEAAAPGERPAASSALREGGTEGSVHWKFAALPKRRWRLVGWVGVVLVLLLILGLALGVSLFTKGSQTTQNTNAPVTQVHPPAYSTYDAHAPAPPQG